MASLEGEWSACLQGHTRQPACSDARRRSAGPVNGVLHCAVVKEWSCPAAPANAPTCQSVSTACVSAWPQEPWSRRRPALAGPSPLVADTVTLRSQVSGLPARLLGILALIVCVSLPAERERCWSSNFSSILVPRTKEGVLLEKINAVEMEEIPKYSAVLPGVCRERV